MNNLTYKGVKSTRFLMGVLLYLMATFIMLVDERLTPEIWLDFAKWVFGTYAASEGLAKGAEAMSNRGQQ